MVMMDYMRKGKDFMFEVCCLVEAWWIVRVFNNVEDFVF